MGILLHEFSPQFTARIEAICTHLQIQVSEISDSKQHHLDQLNLELDYLMTSVHTVSSNMHNLTDVVRHCHSTILDLESFQEIPTLLEVTFVHHQPVIFYTSVQPEISPIPY